MTTPPTPVPALLTTTGSGAPLLGPAEIAALIVTPAFGYSTAAKISQTISVGSNALRIPVLTQDVHAAWVNEGEEIPASDPNLNEILVRFGKVAALSTISTELAMDSSPDAKRLIGESMARDIARKIDAAFFGALPAPAPAGLGAIPSGVQVINASGAKYDTLDLFAAAQSIAETVGAEVDAFVGNPTDVLALSVLKSSLGTYLLQPDPSSPTGRSILGVPVWSNPIVPAGTMWALDQDRCIVAHRTDVTLDISPAPFFTSDRIAVRSTMRVGFAFPQPTAVIKIAHS